MNIPRASPKNIQDIRFSKLKYSQRKYIKFAIIANDKQLNSMKLYLVSKVYTIPIIMKNSIISSNKGDEYSFYDDEL